MLKDIKRSIRMKKILILLAIAAMLGLFYYLVVPARAQQPQPFTCPEGSYSIDDQEQVCKKQPTGCPYGDSVPLGPDCDKLAPHPDDVTVEQQAIVSVPMEGK